MYTKYYGLSEKPFNVTPDPRFLFMSRGHREALASLTYGIQERRGFMVLVGEVGTGKTILINALRERLDVGVSVASLTNTDISFEEMLHQILIEFDLAKMGEHVNKIDALGRLKAFASGQIDKKGNVVIIIDEAQNLDANVLEKIRLLSNTETQQHKLLQIILSGQPELDLILGQHKLRQFVQRISLRRTIHPLSEKETYLYIKHHFLIIDYDGPEIYNRKALRAIWKYTQGVPRKINILCDNAFLIGYALEASVIKTTIVEEAVQDLRWSAEELIYKDVNGIPKPDQPLPIPHPETPDRWRQAAVYLACGVLGVMIGASGWWVWQRNTSGTINTSGMSQSNWEKSYVSSQNPKTEKPIEKPLTQDKNQRTLFADNPAYVLDTELRSKAENRQAALNKQIAKHVGQAEMVFVKSLNEPVPEQSTPIKNDEEASKGTALKIVVKKGDTLSTIIGEKYSAYEKALPVILQLNPEISNPNRLKVGQVITLPQASAIR